MTVPLEDLALSERESFFHAPRAGDVALLGVLVAVLLGNGVWLWRQMGADSHVGRAVFFGLLLLCVYWGAVVYTFKLSLAVGISPRSISVIRGPWRAEIRWSELTRLMERVQAQDGRRYRWIIAIARDGRRISVREDAIGDYARFRREAYERYRVWRDHGGTWGATGSGPFAARETVRDEAQWWGFLAAMIALPGLYFALLLPETNPLGYLLLAAALVCLAMLARAFLQRQSYTVDQRAVEARSALRRTRLTWGEVTKVERIRHPVGGVILSGVALGRLALRLAARGDTGIRSFAWSPRVPEYLVLRGGGRQARIRLHRLMQPDELLAWVEFYDQVRRPASATRSRPRPEAESAPVASRTTGPVSRPLSAASLTPDMSGASGPLDPWGAGRQGDPVASQPTVRVTTPPTPPTPPTRAKRTLTSPRLPDFEPPVEALTQSPHAPESADEAPDLPTVRTPATSAPADASDDAWLRETSALNSMRSSEPAPQTPNLAPEPEPWGYQTEYPPAPEPAQPQPHAADRYVEQDEWQPEQPQPTYGEMGGWQPEPAPQPSYMDPAGWRPDEPQPTHADHRGWQFEAPQPTYAEQGGWQPEPAPQQPPAHDPWAASPRWEADWSAQTPQAPQMPQPAGEERWDAPARDADAHPAEEEEPTAEVEVTQPWRDEGWQPPILPRFGPGGGQRRDDNSDRD